MALKFKNNICCLVCVICVSLATGCDLSSFKDLGYAARDGEIETVRKLLEKGEDVDQREDSSFWTPLMWAAYNGHADIAQLLLDNGAIVNAKETALGRTALMFAAEKGHNDVVKVLMLKGADVKVKDNNGLTVWPYAKDSSNKTTVSLIKEMTVELVDPKSAFAGSILISAASGGLTARVQKMLDKGVDANARNKGGKTALIAAAGEGHIDIVKALLDKGVDANARNKGGKTALIAAAGEGHIDIVKALLDKGADVNAEIVIGGEDYQTTSTNALQEVRVAVARRDKKAGDQIINKLIDAEKKERARGRTPLMKAAENGHTGIVQSLLNKGAKVNEKTTWGA